MIAYISTVGFQVGSYKLYGIRLSENNRSSNSNDLKRIKTASTTLLSALLPSLAVCSESNRFYISSLPSEAKSLSLMYMSYPFFSNASIIKAFLITILLMLHRTSFSRFIKKKKKKKTRILSYIVIQSVTLEH